MKKLRLLIIALTLALAGCSSTKNPYPPAALTNFTPSITVQRNWAMRPTQGSGQYYLRLTPAVSQGVLYIAGLHGRLTAVNSQNGRTLWREKVAKSIASGVGVGDGKLFLGTGRGVLLALNQNNGQVIWHKTLSSELLAAPYVAGNIVLVKSENGNFYGLSTATGKQLWVFQQEMPSLILHASSAPQSVGNLAVAGFANGQLSVVNLQSGRPVWNQAIALPQGGYPVERMVDIDATPIIANGVIYVATYQGKIAALTLKTGRIIWRHNISSYAGIAVGPKLVYVSGAHGTIWAFYRQTGQVAWKQTALTNRGITGPAIIGNAIVVGDAFGYAHFLSRTDGHFLARVQASNKAIITNPIVIGNQVIIYTSRGNLISYRLG